MPVSSRSGGAEIPARVHAEPGCLAGVVSELHGCSTSVAWIRMDVQKGGGAIWLSQACGNDSCAGALCAGVPAQAQALSRSQSWQLTQPR